MIFIQIKLLFYKGCDSMKGNFFENLKKLILEEKDAIELIPYYETLLQQEERLQSLLEDTDKYFYELVFQEDDSGGYTDGKLAICLYTKESGDKYFNSHIADHRYEIKFLHDERYWGFCTCTPDMEGYNRLYRCCGDGCDWTAPLIHVSKIVDIVYMPFDGIEKDMWQLESKWEDGVGKHKEELKNERLEVIEKQIERLESEKRDLMGD